LELERRNKNAVHQHRKKGRGRYGLLKHWKHNPPLNLCTMTITWLLRWAVEVPDLSVSICSANMPWKDKYKHSGDLAAVGLAATVAFVIQHPDESKDAATAGFAAMESTIRAYQKIVQQDPKARFKEMDEVVEIQSQGKLEEYTRDRWTKICKK
jgi:hypothetical protein